MLTLLYHLRQQLRMRETAEESASTAGYLERLLLHFKREQQSSLNLDEDISRLLVEPLSTREREVLWHMSRGHSNREIAEQLVIAPSTVKSHVRAIYTKLGVENRAQALARLHKLKQF